MDILIAFVVTLTRVLTYAIFARIMLSWLVVAGINVSPDNRIVAILYQITDPILVPLRQIIPRIGMLDFSPLIALLALQLLGSLFAGIL